MEFTREIEGFCRALQEKVLKWTGITVAAGVSQTKTLAKLANRGAKKYPATGGVLLLDDERRQKKLMRLPPVNDVWGVGWRLRDRLKAMGIKTTLDLYNANPILIRHQFSVVLQRTVHHPTLHPFFSNRGIYSVGIHSRSSGLEIV